MRRPAAVTVAVAGLLLACSSAGGDDTLTVLAAASLTDAFTDLAARFEDDHPDVEVQVSFAGSQQLVAQISEGAEADVVATADEESMRSLGKMGATFATNRLSIVVEPANPLGIDGLDDLADDDLALVLAAPRVPAGRYAEAVLEGAGVDAHPKSFEENVKAVVTRVALGEADAGIAYVTDVAAAGGAVDGVDIPENENIVAAYPIAALGGDPLGEGFVDLVLSATGRAVLAEHGFAAP